MFEHFGRDVGVNVEREARFRVSEDAGERFGIDSARRCVGGEGVPEIVEAKIREVIIPQDPFQAVVGGLRIERFLCVEEVREDPF